MKTIQILKIKISNFKGIEDLEIEFGKETSIYGFNAMKKSTIGNAIVWCITGEDMEYRKDHEIKNTKKPELNRKDHSVEITFDVDGRHIPVKRIYKETRTGRRGNEDGILTGHMTEVWFDEVKQSTLTEFNNQINNIFDGVSPRLLMSPHHFNTDIQSKWGWKDRRNLLIEMAGEMPSDLEICKSDKSFGILVDIASQGKDMDEQMKKYKGLISEAKKEQEKTEIQIKENLRNLPEEQDWKALEDEILTKKSEVSKLDDQIADKSKVLDTYYEGEQTRLKEINSLKSKAENLKWQAEQEAERKNRDSGKELANLTKERDELGGEIKKVVSKHDRIESEIHQIKEGVDHATKQRDKLRAEFHARNAEEFKVSEDLKCDHCGTELTGDNLEGKLNELRAAFNNKKQSDLIQIKANGLGSSNAIESHNRHLVERQSELEFLTTSLEVLQTKYFELENAVLAESKAEKKTYLFTEFLSPEFEALNTQIKELSEKSSEVPQVNTDRLKELKEDLQFEIESINKVLNVKSEIAKIKARISELETIERNLGDQKAEFEGFEFAIKNFLERKMDLVEKKVNGNFQFVKFKLFKNIISTGYTEPICETMLDDVPWSTLNTGGKLKAGIDIINAFSKYYEVQAPMILDNRESVFEIPFTENQIINLIASEKDKKSLRVEVKN